MKLILKPDSSNDEYDERPLSFSPPEGNYRIVFTHFKQVNGSKTNKPKLRAVWDILFPNDPKFRYRVWKDYPFENGEVDKLKRDLKRIFGKDLSEFNDDSGVFDTDKLLGREAEAKVANKVTDEFKAPLTIVEKLYPIGYFGFDHISKAVSS